jgi:hypothetical protein
MELDKTFRDSLTANYSRKVTKKVASCLRHCGTLIAVKEAELLPKPVEIPRFELQPSEEIVGGSDGIVGGNQGEAFINPKNPEDLGRHARLIRTRLGIKDIPTAMSPTRRRLESELSKKIKDPLTLARIINLTLALSPSGNLLGIARDPELLSRFNNEVGKFGFKLTLRQPKRPVAHLMKIRGENNGKENK